MTKKRVVITGLGVISPVGTGLSKFWNALKSGQSGIDVIKNFDASDFTSRIAGEVDDYDPLEHFNSKEARNLAPFVQYSCVATDEALKQANMDIRALDPSRIGTLIGSGIGAIGAIEDEHQKLIDKGASRISPHFIPRVIINEAPGVTAIRIGAEGPCSSIATACSTATNAIGDAMRFIQYGDCDAMIAGGTEAATSHLGLGGFCALKALSRRNDDPTKASRPFDRERDGFVMGEGAGIAVLESLEHAQARGANILAEIVGYGRTCDAHHITAPEENGHGASRAMEFALKDAGLKPTELSYINAHGTSTYLNDKVETLAVKNLFKEQAAKIPMSSTKSMTGHLLGAAGGIEFAACVQAVLEDIVPPTINYENPDPECDLDYVPNEARQVTVNTAMSNSLGFGGHNASVVIKKFQE